MQRALPRGLRAEAPSHTQIRLFLQQIRISRFNAVNCADNRAWRVVYPFQNMRLNAGLSLHHLPMETLYCSCITVGAPLYDFESSGPRLSLHLFLSNSNLLSNFQCTARTETSSFSCTTLRTLTTTFMQFSLQFLSTSFLILFTFSHVLLSILKRILRLLQNRCCLSSTHSLLVSGRCDLEQYLSHLQHRGLDGITQFWFIFPIFKSGNLSIHYTGGFSTLRTYCT